MNEIDIVVQRVKTGSPNVIAFSVPDNVRDRLLDLVHHIEKKGGWYRLKISLPKRNRSTGPGSQNHHLWGHIQAIAAETGNSPNIVHECLKIRAMEMGYSFVVLGDTAVPIGERDATVEDCAMLIEAAHQLAAEFDVKLKEELS